MGELIRFEAWDVVNVPEAFAVRIDAETCEDAVRQFAKWMLATLPLAEESVQKVWAKSPDGTTREYGVRVTLEPRVAVEELER